MAGPRAPADNSHLPVVTDSASSPASPTAAAADRIVQDQHVSSPALGGTTKCSLVGMITAPIPLRSLANSGAKCIGFVNFGGVGSGPLSLGKPLFGDIRMAAGAGVLLPLMNFRLEATYSAVVVSSQQDEVKPFQIGLGLSIC